MSLASLFLVTLASLLPPGTRSSYSLVPDTTRMLAVVPPLSVFNNISGTAWFGNRGLVMRYDTLARFLELEGDTLRWGASVPGSKGMTRLVEDGDRLWIAQEDLNGVFLGTWDRQFTKRQDSLRIPRRPGQLIRKGTDSILSCHADSCRLYTVTKDGIQSGPRLTLGSTSVVFGVFGDSLAVRYFSGARFLSLRAENFGEMVGALTPRSVPYGNGLALTRRGDDWLLVAQSTQQPFDQVSVLFTRMGNQILEGVSDAAPGRTTTVIQDSILLDHNPSIFEDVRTVGFHLWQGGATPDSVGSLTLRRSATPILAKGGVLLIYNEADYTTRGYQVLRWRLEHSAPTLRARASRDSVPSPQWTVGGSIADKTLSKQTFDLGPLSWSTAWSQLVPDSLRTDTSASGVERFGLGTTRKVRFHQEGGIVSDWVELHAVSSSRVNKRAATALDKIRLNVRDGRTLLSGPEDASFEVLTLDGRLLQKDQTNAQGVALLREGTQGLVVIRFADGLQARLLVP